MMTEPLTATERRVYEYLIDFLAEHTYQPSIREIGRRFRIKSTKTVSDVLQGLAKKGYIERDPSRSRGVRLVGYTGVGGTQAVPYYAGVGTGPGLPPEQRAGHLVLDRRLAPSAQAFLLRAPDDGLRDAGVRSGDYLVVDPQAPAQDGAVVAARVGGAAVIRQYATAPTGYALRAAHPDFPERPVNPGDDVLVLGTVTSVIRTLGGGDPIASPIVMQTEEGQQLQ